MRVTIDLGFWSLVLVAVVGLSVPAVAFFVRHGCRRTAARAEEIKRLLVLANEESVRAETETEALYYHQYRVVSGELPRDKVCAVCYSPTTTRCARCKAVHYCSGKCQIVHWRQDHKDKCHPPSPTCQTEDLVSDLGKKVAEPDYRGVHDEKSQIKSREYATSSDKPLLSDMRCSPDISCARDDSVRVESLQEGNVTGSNSELSSNSFSGFSASTGASESSDDSSVCESVTSNEHERCEGHIFVDPTIDIFYTTCNSIGESIPLSPKFASLVDLVDGNPAMHKLNQIRPDFSKQESKLTLNGSSGLCMWKGATIEPITVSSGFWNTTLDSTRIKDDSNSDPLASHYDDSAPKSVKNNMPCARSASSENEGVGCADALSIHNLQTVGLRVSNHVINTGSTLKSAQSRCLPHAFADTKLVSRTEEHSHYSTKCGNNGIIQSGSATSNSKNDLKTSVLKVSDQLRGSKLSKPFPSAVGSDITGKYSDKGLFPYDLFVKLYNWNRVELQPFGLINCGNSCYANAVLQCLAVTPPLTAYLLQGLHSKSCANKKWCFTCEFESLILKSKDTNSPMSPLGILSQLQNIGSQLGNGREEDAHEFLRLVVETMQSVCLMESGDNMSDSLKEETNLMGLTFGGYLQSKIKCMKCGGKSERQERMMDLTVEIEGEIATLEEALRQFTSAETLDGENKYRCVRCKSYEKAKKKMTVLEAPNVLTIALKRFQVTAVELESVLAKGAYMLFYSRCSPRAPRLIRNSIVSSDSKWKLNGKTATMKSRRLSTGAGVNLTSPGGSASLDTLYSKFLHSKRILEEDSSSDNSSLISSNSDEGSCSTDSTADSTSTDDFADYIFGDVGRGAGGMLRNSDSNICPALPSFPHSGYFPSSDIDQHDSVVLPHSTGFQPSPSEEGLLYRNRVVDVKRSGGGVSHFHLDTNIEHRKLDTSSSSISFRETDSVFNDRNSGVSCTKSRYRTD
ncbi:hypothetical protein GLYMA_02G213400v4 [Glycine max]|nr:hypothetical protein GLYMA_02G213400v4 [Glycine max]|eukprot:XP_025981938.1 ubiquitin carboxyl-terminal hydrolase 16 isoform X2 [Glycine max]